MKKRRPPILSRVGVALGALSLLVVGLWVFRIPLAENMLRARLLEMGHPAANVEIRSLNPWLINIRNFWLDDGNRLQRGEVSIEWPTLISPRIVTVELTGLELELGDSPTGLAWRGMIPAFQGAAAQQQGPVADGQVRLPEIQIRDATIRLVVPDDAIDAVLVVPSFSFVPTHDYANEGAEGNARQAGEVAAELVLSNARARGWAVTGGVFKSAGRIERHDGQLVYHPHGCEQVSLTGLKREQVAVSGSLSVCMKAGGQGGAVVIGGSGGIDLDVIVVPDTAKLGLAIAALPPIPLELEGGSLHLQLSREAEGLLLGNIALRDLNLRLPASGIAFDALEVAAITGSDEAAPQGWSFTLGARALSHVADLPAFRPLALEGSGNWTPQALVFDATLRQAGPALNAGFHLHRDSETGEGEISFDVSPLEFREGGMQVDDVSPLLARQVAVLSGEVEAAGRILFNDAWATPLQIAGTGKNLVVKIRPSPSSMTDAEVMIDFGRSRFDISLPPLSPERGWATLDVIDGELRHGDVDLKGSTGPINFLSLWPLSCREGGEPGTTVMHPGDRVAATIIACLQQALTMDR